jgi:hypothetical protein
MDFYTTATYNLEKIPHLVSQIDPELGRQSAEVTGLQPARQGRASEAVV